VSYSGERTGGVGVMQLPLNLSRRISNFWIRICKSIQLFAHKVSSASVSLKRPFPIPTVTSSTIYIAIYIYHFRKCKAVKLALRLASVFS